MEKKGTNPNLKSFLSHMVLSGQFFSNLTWFWTLWHLSQTPAMCADSKSILTLCAYRPQSYIYIYYIIVEQLRSCKVLSDKLGISPVETDIMCFVQSALLLLQVLERPAGSREAERLRQWITKTCGSRPARPQVLLETLTDGLLNSVSIESVFQYLLRRKLVLQSLCPANQPVKTVEFFLEMTWRTWEATSRFSGGKWLRRRCRLSLWTA